MPACRCCGSIHEADELTRHVHEEWVVVHCPDCHAAMGSYRLGAPAVDTMRKAN
ncbi:MULTISPECIES: hypothetical protein [Haloferax]|uniref:hypothetical protein n=1 Tax=Haloferax TaxID=2251 RepID=UPI0017805A25|nr:MULTISPECIES: hypothetical protein [Haloferax]